MAGSTMANHVVLLGATKDSESEEKLWTKRLLKGACSSW